MILPGGFSYGDYLRSGAIARFSPIMQAVQAHAAAGGAVVGICNGFQILCEAHLLPGALMRNAGLTFVSQAGRCAWSSAPTPSSPGPSTGRRRCGCRWRMARDATSPTHETLARLEGEGQVVLRYVEARLRRPRATRTARATTSPAICNAAGTIVGIMPHPSASSTRASARPTGCCSCARSPAFAPCQELPDDTDLDAADRAAPCWHRRRRPAPRPRFVPA